MNSSKIRRAYRFSLFDIALYVFFVLLGICFLYPIWYCLITALSSASAIRHELPMLWPADITLDVFVEVFNGKNILLYYYNSIFYSVVGTLISLTLTAMMAYPFIISDFKGKKAINIFLVITMFFSGGLLPYYFLINGIHWRNTVWVMLIPGAVSAFNVVVFRTFFKSIPFSLLESAYMDGAGHYRVLIRILVPVTKPLFATFALFGLVGKWNDWFTGYLFFTKEALMPIQQYLTELLNSISQLPEIFRGLRSDSSNIIELNIKCAIVIITIAPILCVYPFLQKFFTSGIMIGSIKA